ncbi:hypothetical protein [Bacillus toyonensis]|uniref:hypothetical protein n=1 Tax=Bacillus toyonensis TaxID=155322 RepID=UPI000BFE3E20|nr:hypothetical protein [Bacillus toyonensis]MDR4971610.1 hypothetical protein [Bacillus toyonensis]PHD99135.1 hypothetical protein COF43_15530 [Bacillus toyonensis]
MYNYQDSTQMPNYQSPTQVPNTLPVTAYIQRPQITIESVRPAQGKGGFIECHQVCYKVCVGGICYRECVEVC